MQFCTGVDIQDVVTSANFGSHLYNTLKLPCQSVIERRPTARQCNRLTETDLRPRTGVTYRSQITEMVTVVV